MKPFAIILLTAIGMVGPSLAVSGEAVENEVTVSDFGSLPDGREAKLYSLENGSGGSVSFTNLGAIIVSLRVPDREGITEDVVFGFDEAAPYLDSPYFGAVVGRYANRIAEGRFELNGESYRLATNNGPNHLHGGDRGFDKRLWDGKVVETEEGAGVRFSLVSTDGDEGYPGELRLSVTYTFTGENDLIIDYRARADEDTVFNVSQHSYFNLAGQNAGTVLDHTLQINAGFYTPVDKTLIPTGEIVSVADTPFDFTEAKPVGRDIGARHKQLAFGGGYDHNWVLRSSGLEDRLHTAAILADPDSGRQMEVVTDQPGLQFYSGNFLDGSIAGKAGATYQHRSAVALETQHYPDSPNQSHFPSTTLKAGEIFKSRTIYRFRVVD